MLIVLVVKPTAVGGTHRDAFLRTDRRLGRIGSSVQARLRAFLPFNVVLSEIVPEKTYCLLFEDLLQRLVYPLPLTAPAGAVGGSKATPSLRFASYD